MAITTLEQMYSALISGRTSDDVRQILADIGDHAGIEIDQPFGQFELEWHAFGDNLSNNSSVGLATKPGRSLAERITNAMDAALESRVPKGVVSLPGSCREAASQWFGRPVTGPADGLFKWKYSENGFDRLVNVVLTAPQPNNAATVDVIDAGIGLAPDRFHDTILSLQRGNKMTKHYLIGAFGQGGASTLAFSDYVVIVSRSHTTPDVVGFTVVRVINLGLEYKEDAYAYLCLKRPDPTAPAVVPSVNIKASEPIVFYGEGGLTREPPSLSVGTLVRHVGYKLPSLSGTLSPSSGNLYHYLHVSLFDPLLPFRAIDLRNPEKARDELITGSRNRLMQRLERKLKDDGTDEEQGRIEIRHHRPLEYVTPHGATTPCIGIEYWVVYAHKKVKDSSEKWRLRPSSNELYVSKGYPIVGTLNGQNQGEQTARLLRDLSLTMTANHIVIHIDASGADSQVRRGLFSTNREGFKDGPILDSLMNELRQMLQEDAELTAIETELTERLTKRDTEQTNSDVRNQITALLLESGFKVSKPGTSFTPGGESETVTILKPRPPVPHPKPAPLPTLPYPQVTMFDVRYPEDVLRVRLNGSAGLMVETDADERFDIENRISIRSEPPSLEVAAKSPLRGGRARWRLRPREDDSIKPGQTGKVIVALTMLDGVQLQCEVDYELLPPSEAQQKVDKGLVPPFEILPVSPHKEEDEETWAMLWPELTETATPEELARVAYKTMRQKDNIVVYYSTVFGPYTHVLEKLKAQNPAKASLFEIYYAVWIGYHAILQEKERTKATEGLDDEQLSAILEEERIRVATIQTKQAQQTATMKYELTRAAHTEIE